MKISNHESDLYVLPETKHEEDLIVGFVNNNSHSWHYSYSNVPGQDWYGKRFIEIPFRVDLEKALTDWIKLNQEGKRYENDN